MSMDTRMHTEMLKLRDAVYDAQLKASASRHLREGDTWIEYELDAVECAANQWAEAHGLRMVDRQTVERLEGPAVGHVDYMRKVALYVAEYVYGYDGGPW